MGHFVSYLVYAVVQFKVDFKGFSGHCSQGRSGHCPKQRFDHCPLRTFSSLSPETLGHSKDVHVNVLKNALVTVP